MVKHLIGDSRLALWSITIFALAAKEFLIAVERIISVVLLLNVKVFWQKHLLSNYHSRNNSSSLAEADMTHFATLLRMLGMSWLFLV